jgi:L-threonylcarbamoyladenylate synthase
MIILKISAKKRGLAVREAVRALKRGDVIAFPTETTYGLGCDPRNAAAVRRIYRIKGRDDGKPLQLIAGSLAQVRRLASLDGGTAKLIRKHWPGPLTLLLQLRASIKLTSKVSPKRIIGIRVTSSAFVRELALAFGAPIAATSANRSGRPPASSGRAAASAFASGEKPDLLIDIGALPKRSPSTVARVKDDGTVEVLRRGPIRLPNISRHRVKRYMTHEATIWTNLTSKKS